MATETEDRPSLEEQHLRASNTSSLLIDERHHGADIVVAAGMASQGRNQLGLALIHLRSEWDRCDKPRKKTLEEIGQRAQELKAAKTKDHKRRANAEALVWHATAMRQRAAALSGRNAVLGLLGDWAAFYGVDPDLLSPALFHWLAPACGACDGRGKYKIPDTPSLSDKDCIHCNGTGTWPRPPGAERIHNHFASCLARVKKAMAGKLYG